MLDKTSGVNNVVSCYKEAVQFSVFIVTSLFAKFQRNLWNGTEFCIFFFVWETLIKITNTPLDRSTVLVSKHTAAALASAKSG